MKNLRLTPQRKLILEELAKTTSHPTAGELYDVVRKRLPRISLGTVYRNLELLASQGLIRKLELSGAPARYDARCDGHYHVRCVRCGRVDDIPIDPLSELENAIRSVLNYELSGIRVEGVGICPECRMRSETAVFGVDGGPDSE